MYHSGYDSGYETGWTEKKNITKDDGWIRTTQRDAQHEKRYLIFVKILNLNSIRGLDEVGVIVVVVVAAVPVALLPTRRHQARDLPSRGNAFRNVLGLLICQHPVHQRKPLRVWAGNCPEQPSAFWPTVWNLKVK